MILKVYQKYIIKNFILLSLKITFVFLTLGFVIGILEEINFFNETDVKFYFPVFLVFLNLPSLIYEIFPFIFLLSSQFFFIRLLETNEINALKNNGLSNIKILSILTFTTLLIGILISVVFYNLSATLKFQYLDIKKNYTKDNKYLATITENGLWIKDEYDNKINFINSKQFYAGELYEVDIIQLDNNFNFIKNIKSSKADITRNEWKLYDSMIISENNKISEFDLINFNTNFNFEEINKLFSNLSSLTFWKLNALKNNYKKINYSTTEIDQHIQKIISYPFLITIITLLSCIVMLNIQYQKPKLFIVVIGILLSVSIYYFNFFFGALGKNERIPLYIATWMPILILFIFSLIGLIRINEK